MQLKRLEVAGFKSFADRTVLEFGPGMTAVVGPNGCGKSNISDAVRWVLGEQSARLLRGSRMEDLIFNGSAGRRALGMAEVSLTIDNSDGSLPTDYREVVISRRMDRGGGSEYLLNRVPVRLRDIQELLYDTGLGRDAYTLVGQGRIDEVLAARAEDRRSLLEEAAGIVRFKARRQEAVRRLRSVEQRLTRLGDIVAELETRLGPLAHEAERARRHRELSERLAELERELQLAELQRLTRQLRQRERAVRQAREALEQLRAEVTAGQARVGDLRREAAELDQRLDEAREHLDRLAAEAEAASARRQVIEERRQHLEARRDQLVRDLDDLRQSLQQRQGEASVDDRRLAELKDRHARLVAERRDLEAQLAGLEEDAAQAESRLAAVRAEAFEALRRSEAARGEAQAAESELRSLAERRARLDQDLAEAVAGEAQIRADLQRLAAEVDDTRRQLESARRQVDEGRDGVHRARQEVRSAESRLRDLQERLADARGRVRTLSELQRAYEGFFAGVRAALRGRDAGDPAFAGIIGVVAELVRTDRRYEAALEAALGGAVQNLVTRTADDAQRAVAGLRQHRAGRATFLPLDGLRSPSRRPDDDRLLALPGIIGWAVDLVQFDPDVRTAVDYLLGRVLVAEDLTAARRAARQSGFSLRVVTLEGDVVHPGGPISGGSRQQQRGGLISRRRDLEEAEQQAARLEEEYGRARAALEQARQQVEDLEARRAAAEADVNRLGAGLQALERELAAARQRQEAAGRRRRSLEDEVAALAKRAADLTRAAQEAQLRAASEAERAEAARAQAAEMEARFPEAQRRAAEGRERLAAVTAAAEAAAEQLQALEAMAERARREQADLEARRQAAETELQAVTGQIAECGRQLEETSGERERLARERSQGQEVVDSLRQARKQAAEALQSCEEALESARRRFEEQSARTHRAEFEEARVRDEWERLRASLGLEAAATVEPGDDAAPEPSAREIAAAAREAQRLRGELHELGPVNPGAEQEYVSVRERHRFLRGQMDDLTGARARLEELVADIDRHMEVLFRATFSQLRERFQHIFQRLFGGGRADLVLTAPDPGESTAAGDDEAEPPAAGVDIIAQPPGKRMQPLSLLSGGERALTAIALMFAMLEVKAPPFCILDEIDAALDEHNLRRYVDYLVELSRRIQFIVITHQKTTMAAADTLYGVTLGEGGASRLVAVRLAAAAGAAGQ